MELIFTFINIFSVINLVTCRDFYIGMFKKDDYLVAQDYVYKERMPYKYTTAQYGRHFKCQISYFRVVDRLGRGGGPYTTIVRGGIQKNYIAVNIKSNYDQPISVNIYVGCGNKTPVTHRRPKKTTTTPTIEETGQNGTKVKEAETGVDSANPGGVGGGGGTTQADIGEESNSSLLSGPVELSGPIEALSGPIKTSSGPIEKLSGPIEKLSGPIETLSGPIETLSGPIETLSGPLSQSAEENYKKKGKDGHPNHKL